MKPYQTLRQLLVHPKDQRTVEQTGEYVTVYTVHDSMLQLCTGLLVVLGH